MPKDNFFPPLPLSNGLVGVPTLNLYDGLQLKGEKMWQKARQNLVVDIKHIDRTNDLIYGFMTEKIRDRPSKVTYFEGEIIGEKHPFLTRKWRTNAETDKRHWLKFDCFCKYVSDFSSEEFDYTCLQASDQVFMRWKETQSIDNLGEVAPGFYYVCLTKSSGNCEGMYYERDCAEWNQDTFFLRQVPQKSFPVYQFR